MRPLDPATLVGLPSLIGGARLAPYLAACGSDRNSAIRLYAWNVEASSALLGAFAALEVGIRNAIHGELQVHFGRADWWSVAPLGANEISQLSEATSYLDRRKGVGRWSEGHVVAELKLSFWEGLLVNRYHSSLWQPAIQHAFTHFGGRRGDLRTQLERLRLLRNRAAHHEPIHARDLNIDHKYMCEVAGYVAPDLRDWVVSHSRLPSVIAGRIDTVAGLRPTRF